MLHLEDDSKRIITGLHFAISLRMKGILRPLDIYLKKDEALCPA